MAPAIINRVRQNHALEHGTISVLLEKGAHAPLAGNAAPGGFYIYGKVSTEDVTAAVSEALSRLQSGQRELAVSPFCGTNLVVGALLAALLSGIIMGRSRSRLRQIPSMATAILGATLLGRPLGRIVQQRYTTLSDVADLEITAVRRFTMGDFTVHRLSTGRVFG